MERYARRGVFRSFSHAGGRFHFHWLRDLPFHMTFDRKSGALAFPGLLPNVAARSEIELGLKAFVRSLSAKERPGHRRVDRARLAVRCTNRGGTVSLSFVMIEDNPEYAVRKALEVVNEVFLGYLGMHHPEYMAENFRLPLE